MRVILVDDLVIQPQGIKAAISLLKEAGAARIDLRIASPQIVTNCSWGTRLPDIEDLAANKSNNVKTTAPLPPSLADIGARSVKYLSHTGFMELIGSGFCDHCFLQP
jgi:amidophosphoribosyltransferase